MLLMGRKKTKQQLILVGITVLLILTILSSGCIEKNITGKTRGGFYTNDSGEPKGGWEYTENFYANLTLTNGIGKLTIEPYSKDNDKLKKHNYTAILQEYTPETMQLLIDGRQVILKWIKNDTIWDHTWDNHYIASYGISMPTEDTIGSIKPEIFPGLLPHYYVELRLPKITTETTRLSSIHPISTKNHNVQLINE